MEETTGMIPGKTLSQTAASLVACLRSVIVLAAFMFLVVAAAPVGQQPQAPSSPSDASIRVDADLVTFPVTVTARKGRAVTGLKAEDFRVFVGDNAAEHPGASDPDQQFRAAERRQLAAGRNQCPAVAVVCEVPLLMDGG